MMGPISMGNSPTTQHHQKLQLMVSNRFFLELKSDLIPSLGQETKLSPIQGFFFSFQIAQQDSSFKSFENPQQKVCTTCLEGCSYKTPEHYQRYNHGCLLVAKEKRYSID